MRKIVVCGTIAYDNIMTFPGYFKDNILPEKIDTFNLDLVTNSLTKSIGGTATNISYNLSLLEEKTIINGTVGKDFEEFNNWFVQNKIDTKNIKILDNEYTSTCFMITDLECNMIAGFYSGAMSKDSEQKLTHLDLTGVSMVIISPTDPLAMIMRAEESKKLSIPYLFDPGMLLSRFKAEDLIKGIFGAEILVLNEHEYNLLINITGLSKDLILNNVKLLVITKGEKGSVLETKNEQVQIPSVKTKSLVYPIGAGDAYKAGLIKGYLENKPLLIIGRYASISASYAIEFKGTVEHTYTLKDFFDRYNKNNP